jgi:DNA-binding transcriptional ArsR family regulator
MLFRQEIPTRVEEVAGAAMQEVTITLEQFKSLNSVLRVELLTSLSVHGPGTARDIAERLGFDEHKLYYHLKKLLAAGLVVIEGSRKTATKPEAIFKALARMWVPQFDQTDPEVARAVDRHYGLFLKVAAREHSAAVMSPDPAIYRLTMVLRGSGVLNDQHTREFLTRMKALNDWLLSLDDPGGMRCGCTFSFQPTVDRKVKLDTDD